MRFILTPWKTLLLSHAAKAERSIVLISPFIKRSIAEELIFQLQYNRTELNVVSRCKPDDFGACVSDIDALKTFISYNENVKSNKIVYDNKLHAKIFIFDDRVAYVGSSNLTSAGLERNYEGVIEIDDPQQVRSIKRDTQIFFDTCRPITRKLLAETERKVADSVRRIKVAEDQEGTFYQIPDSDGRGIVEPAEDIQALAAVEVADYACETNLHPKSKPLQ